MFVPWFVFCFFSLSPQKNGVSVWFFSQWKCLLSSLLDHFMWTFKLSGAHLCNGHSGVSWNKWLVHSAFSSIIILVTSYFCVLWF